MTAPAPSPFVALMRRYIEDYCNHHDTSVCREIMAPEYTLHMGGRTLRGRDEDYVPAASAAFARVPTLRLVVHEVLAAGDRFAMRFSEHGTTADGHHLAWHGIGVYRWDGTRLVENFVEQDYAARARQLAAPAGTPPDPLEPLDPDPWSTPEEPGDPAAADVVRRWLASGDLLDAPAAVVDDSWLVGAWTAPFPPEAVDVDDCFAAGRRVAAHVTCRAGDRAWHASLVAHVADGSVARVRAVTDHYHFLPGGSS